MRRLVLFLGLFLGSPLVAAPPEKPIEPPSADELASIMRTLLVTSLPAPLVEQNSNWGHQKEVANGITWKNFKPSKQKKLKNDGTWRRIRVDAVNPEKELKLQVTNVQKPEKGMLTFDMVVTLPTRIKFEQQLWKAGVRVYSGETRARCLWDGAPRTGGPEDWRLKAKRSIDRMLAMTAGLTLAPAGSRS